MTRTLMFAAATLLAVTTGSAFAEGNGNPFPPATSASVVASPLAGADVGSNAYPKFGPAVVALSAGGLLPTVGSNGIVQTANSAPPGFADPVQENGHAYAFAGFNAHG